MRFTLWGVQMAGMIFKTRSKVRSIKKKRHDMITITVSPLLFLYKCFRRHSGAFSLKLPVSPFPLPGRSDVPAPPGIF
ncbi:DUF6783 domain-containing protein [uncultured Clostridium sp.]|uniref:DUF6783 domain-containing protein n=1 Tax=uncultured Clostridium sp. TaxID=59620 RepID=UPI003457F03E